MPIHTSQIPRISEWEAIFPEDLTLQMDKAEVIKSVILPGLELNLPFPKIEFFPTHKWVHEKKNQITELTHFRQMSPNFLLVYRYGNLWEM